MSALRFYKFIFAIVLSGPFALLWLLILKGPGWISRFRLLTAVIVLVGILTISFGGYISYALRGSGFYQNTETMFIIVAGLWTPMLIGSINLVRLVQTRLRTVQQKNATDGVPPP